MSDAASTGSVGELRAVRRGRITISRLHRSGPRPYRLLLVGSRKVVGAGHPSADDRWFAEHLADRTWLQLRRGVDLDVLWELRPVLSALRRSVVPWRLWRYDAVVLMLTAPPGAAAGARLLGLPSLVRTAIERLARFSAVLLVALEPAALQRSLGVERLAAAALPADEEHRAVRALVLPRDAAAGADRIAQELVDPALDTASAAPEDEDAEEPLRLRALHELGLREGVAPPELDRLVRSARAAFDVHLAAVNVVEQDRVLNIAASGAVRSTHLPRALALCDAALLSRDAVVILDTWADPALAANEVVRGDPPVRFFAAYPLESLEGHRIGAFCIYDTVPREAQEVDLELLRDFALLAEAAVTAPSRPASDR